MLNEFVSYGLVMLVGFVVALIHTWLRDRTPSNPKMHWHSLISLFVITAAGYIAVVVINGDVDFFLHTLFYFVSYAVSVVMLRPQLI